MNQSVDVQRVRDVVAGECIRQNFDRDVSLELLVPGAKDFAHSAFTDGGSDLVGPKTLSNMQRHRWCVFYGRGMGCAIEFETAEQARMCPAWSSPGRRHPRQVNRSLGPSL